MSSPVTVRVLGRFEVLVDGAPAELGGMRQRAVLAILTLHRGAALSLDRLVDELWDGDAPATGRKAVQVYVSQLRRALGDAATALATVDGGYCLSSDVGTDVDDFERLAAEGRERLDADEPEAAAELFRQALDLWRGEPLDDFAYEGFAREEIRRLDEARIATLESRVDADLRCGHHGHLVSELESLVAQYPLRERLRGQLMLALYRSGRQGDALGAYQDGRRALAEELGLDPGPELQRLQAAILAQDPSLDSPARPGRAVPHARWSRLLLVGGALLVAAAIAAVAVVGLRGGGSNPVGVRTIASGRCGSLRYGGAGSPQFVIAADLPLQPGVLETTTAMANAMTLELQRHGYKAGRYPVGLQVCDDATPRSPYGDDRVCSANAFDYVKDPSVIAVAGPFTSGCAVDEIPTLNGARGGPLAIVSPSATLVGLTRSPARGSAIPAVLYPTRVRNFARIIPADDAQAAADAIVARQLGVKRVYAVDQGDPGTRSFAASFIRAVQRLGLGVAGRESWNTEASSYAPVISAIARTHADCVFLAVASSPQSVRLLTALRRGLGRRAQLMAFDGFDPAAAVLAGPAAERMTISQPGPAYNRLGEEGRRLVASFSKRFGGKPTRYAVAAAQAIDVLLGAIAGSDGTRSSVTSNLFKTQISNGILGSFGITPTGDTTLNVVAIYRIIDGKVTTYADVVVPDALLGQN